MKVTKLALAVAIMLVSIYAKAQTVDDIINKHLSAIGGTKLLKTVKTMLVQSTVTVTPGGSGVATTIFSAGAGYRRDLELGPAKITEVVTNKSGWAIRAPLQTDAEPMPDGVFKSSEGYIYIDPFIDYIAHGDKVMLGGIEDGAYLLKTTNKDSAKTVYYVDTSTYYIIKLVRSTEVMSHQMIYTATYADHAKTEFGMVVPYTSQVVIGGVYLTASLQKITFNVPVDPHVFEMPAPQGKGLNAFMQGAQLPYAGR